MVIGIKLGYTRDMISFLEEVYQRQPRRRNFMMIDIWCNVISHLGWNVKHYLAKCLADAGHADIADTLGTDYNISEFIQYKRKQVSPKTTFVIRTDYTNSNIRLFGEKGVKIKSNKNEQHMVNFFSNINITQYWILLIPNSVFVI